MTQTTSSAELSIKANTVQIMMEVSGVRDPNGGLASAALSAGKFRFAIEPAAFPFLEPGDQVVVTLSVVKAFVLAAEAAPPLKIIGRTN